MHLKKKRIFKLILLILVILAMTLILKYTHGIIESIYSYKIKQAEKAGNHIEVEENYKKKIFLNRKNKISKQFILDNLIKFYVSQKLYSNALDLCLERMDSGTFCPVNGCSIFSNRELDKASMFNDVAFLYLKLNNFAKANEYISKAIDLLNSMPSESGNKKILLTSHTLQARIEIKKANFLKAKEYLNKAKEIVLSSDPLLKSHSELLLEYYQTLIEYYIQKEDYKLAKNYTEKLFSLIPSSSLPPDLVSELSIQGVYLINFNTTLGKICYKLDDYENAQRHYEISYHLSNELNGKYYPDTICTKYALLKVYEKMDRKNNIKKYSDEIIDEVKNFKLLKNTNNGNFRENLDRFCNM